MYSTLNKVGDYSAVLAAVAAIVIVILGYNYFFGLERLTVLYAVFGSYVAFNLAEGLWMQPDPEDRKQDVITSRAACLALTFATLFVVGHKVAGTELPAPLGMHEFAVLLGTFVFSWVHVTWILSHKNAQFKQWLQDVQDAGARTAWPGPPAYTPPAAGAVQPRKRKVWPLILALLFVVGVVYVLLNQEKTKAFFVKLLAHTDIYDNRGTTHIGAADHRRSATKKVAVVFYKEEGRTVFCPTC